VSVTAAVSQAWNGRLDRMLQSHAEQTINAGGSEPADARESSLSSPHIHRGSTRHIMCCQINYEPSCRQCWLCWLRCADMRRAPLSLTKTWPIPGPCPHIKICTKPRFSLSNEYVCLDSVFQGVVCKKKQGWVAKISGTQKRRFWVTASNRLRSTFGSVSYGRSRSICKLRRSFLDRGSLGTDGLIGAAISVPN